MLRGNGFRMVATGGLLCLAALVTVGCSDGGSAGGAVLAPQWYSPLVNKAPVIHEIDLSSVTVGPNGTVAIEVTASDPENDELTYTYASSCPGSEMYDLGCQCLWTLSEQEGVYCIQVTVSDGRLLTTERAYVTVQPVTVIVRPGSNGS